MIDGVAAGTHRHRSGATHNSASVVPDLRVWFLALDEQSGMTFSGLNFKV